MTKELEIATIESIDSEHLNDIVPDLIEKFANTKIVEDALEAIPIIKHLYSGYKTYISISDQLLFKKLSLFIHEFDQVSHRERHKFIVDLNTDPKQKQKVGETLIQIIARLDDFEKPGLIAKLFIAFLQNKITHEDFLRTSIAIERTFIEDIKKVKKCYKNSILADNTLKDRLFYGGFLSLDMGRIGQHGSGGAYGGGGPSYKTNEIGNIFVQHT